MIIAALFFRRSRQVRKRSRQDRLRKIRVVQQRDHRRADTPIRVERGDDTSVWQLGKMRGEVITDDFSHPAEVLPDVRMKAASFRGKPPIARVKCDGAQDRVEPFRVRDVGQHGVRQLFEVRASAEQRRGASARARRWAAR